MMKKTNKLGHLRGFTLIELLVVIAIIGILASVVLASLNSARDKGSNAAIKSNLANARSQAELYYDSSGQTYAGLCTSTATSSVPGIADNVAAADAANGAGGADCNDDVDAWAVAAQLVGSESTEYYCIDSTGFSGEKTGEVGDEFGATDFACN